MELPVATKNILEWVLVKETLRITVALGPLENPGIIICYKVRKYYIILKWENNMMGFTTKNDKHQIDKQSCL